MRMSARAPGLLADPVALPVGIARLRTGPTRPRGWARPPDNPVEADCRRGGQVVSAGRLLLGFVGWCAE